MDKSITMKKIPIFLLVALILSCKSNPKTSNVFKIEGSKDSCYKFTDSVKRQVEIIENTLQDTVLLGFTVVPPKYVGNFNYLGIDGRNDAVIYPETPEQLMPKTTMICINLYKQRKVKGYLILKVKN